MEKITAIQESVLEVIEEKLEEINGKLKKYEPLIIERDRLLQTRRVLLSEKSSTGGGGRSNTRITMEEVITFLREKGASSPSAIAEGLNVDSSVIRSHLNRHKDERYEMKSRGVWDLAEADEEDDDEDDEEE